VRQVAGVAVEDSCGSGGGLLRAAVAEEGSCMRQQRPWRTPACGSDGRGGLLPAAAAAVEGSCMWQR
jgi:hypothetical protein